MVLLDYIAMDVVYLEKHYIVIQIAMIINKFKII